MALRNKHVAISDICLGCCNNPEDTFYALVKCPLAKDVWKLSALGDLSVVVNSFRDWWILVFQRQNMEELNKTAMFLWSIWNSRNDLVWNRRKRSSYWIFNAALQSLIQWQQTRVPSVPQGLHRVVSSAPRWKKPEASWVKCNIDAALFNQFQCIGVDCIIRDEYGVMISARNAKLKGPLDPANELQGSIELVEVSWVK